MVGLSAAAAGGQAAATAAAAGGCSAAAACASRFWWLCCPFSRSHTAGAWHPAAWQHRCCHSTAACGSRSRGGSSGAAPGAVLQPRQPPGGGAGSATTPAARGARPRPSTCHRCHRHPLLADCCHVSAPTEPDLARSTSTSTCPHSTSRRQAVRGPRNAHGGLRRHRILDGRGVLHPHQPGHRPATAAATHAPAALIRAWAVSSAAAGGWRSRHARAACAGCIEAEIGACCCAGRCSGLACWHPAGRQSDCGGAGRQWRGWSRGLG